MAESPLLPGREAYFEKSLETRREYLHRAIAMHLEGELPAEGLSVQHWGFVNDLVRLAVFRGFQPLEQRYDLVFSPQSRALINGLPGNTPTEDIAELADVFSKPRGGERFFLLADYLEYFFRDHLLRQREVRAMAEQIQTRAKEVARMREELGQLKASLTSTQEGAVEAAAQRQLDDQLDSVREQYVGLIEKKTAGGFRSATELKAFQKVQQGVDRLLSSKARLIVMHVSRSRGEAEVKGTLETQFQTEVKIALHEKQMREMELQIQYLNRELEDTRADAAIHGMVTEMTAVRKLIGSLSDSGTPLAQVPVLLPPWEGIATVRHYETLFAAIGRVDPLLFVNRDTQKFGEPRFVLCASSSPPRWNGHSFFLPMKSEEVKRLEHLPVDAPVPIPKRLAEALAQYRFEKTDPCEGATLEQVYTLLLDGKRDPARARVEFCLDYARFLTTGSYGGIRNPERLKRFAGFITPHTGRHAQA